MKIEAPKQLVELSKRLAMPVYIVGGYIRNQIMGLDCTDIDICGAFDFAEFEKTGASVSIINKRLGTALVQFGGQRFEYTRFRKESYGNDGSHSPQSIEFCTDINQDALRRDFCLNSIYYDVSGGKIIDPLDGIGDINKRIIRAHNPHFTFKDDGLRLMRLCRFACQLGFDIDTPTLEAAIKNNHNLKDIAPERKREELDKILYADRQYGISDAHYYGLKYLSMVDLWQYILPSMTIMQIPQNPKFHKHDVLEHSFLAVKYAPPEVRLAALMHDTGKPVCQREHQNMRGHAEVSAQIVLHELGQKGLKYPSKVIEDVSRLVRLHMYDLHQLTSEGKMKLFVAENIEYIDRLQQLCMADAKATGMDTTLTPRFLYYKNLLIQQNAPLSIKQLKIDGNDIIKKGITGKNIALTLERLWCQCILDPKLNNKEWLEKNIIKA